MFNGNLVRDSVCPFAGDMGQDAKAECEERSGKIVVPSCTHLNHVSAEAENVKERVAKRIRA
jgi:hypothetical protein